MEGSQLIRPDRLVVVLFGMLGFFEGCSKSESQSPNPEKLPQQSVWIGESHGLHVLVQYKEYAEEVRRNFSQRDAGLLEIAEQLTIYRLDLCLDADKPKMELPFACESASLGLSGLPPKAPSTPRGELLWRALGGDQEKIQIDPGQCQVIHVLGPLTNEAEEEQVEIKIGALSIPLQKKNYLPEVLRAFRSRPHGEFFKVSE